MNESIRMRANTHTTSKKISNAVTRWVDSVATGRARRSPIGAFSSPDRSPGADSARIGRHRMTRPRPNFSPMSANVADVIAAILPSNRAGSSIMPRR